MNQSERRRYLINELLKENPQYAQVEIPGDRRGQQMLLRALLNVRMPGAVSEEFRIIQDEYLKERAKEKGIVSLAELTPVKEHTYLWQGDITRLKVDAIVNAANSGMTGCYHPNHNCIDNCIHTYSGVELRLACAKLMEAQGHEEPAGRAKITPAYNLPCRYVLHTVGPIVQGDLTERDCELLASCYRSCLALAEEERLNSIAFCCISTGVFCFPNEEAARIAVETTEDFHRRTGSRMEVVYNVFKELDLELYRTILR